MINVAMVGLGRWGQTVLNSIQGKSSSLRIVHGVTKEPELARELAAKHGFRLSTDLKDAIADPQVGRDGSRDHSRLSASCPRRVEMAGGSPSKTFFSFQFLTSFSARSVA